MLKVNWCFYNLCVDGMLYVVIYFTGLLQRKLEMSAWKIELEFDLIRVGN